MYCEVRVNQAFPNRPRGPPVTDGPIPGLSVGSTGRRTGWETGHKDRDGLKSDKVGSGSLSVLSHGRDWEDTGRRWILAGWVIWSQVAPQVLRYTYEYGPERTAVGLDGETAA
jgi:hypothetical protein